LVKIALSFFLVISIAFGDLIDDKIKNFIGENRFYSAKKIVNILLGDKKQYYRADGTINVVKMLRVLKKNGFLRLDLKQANNVDITFTTKENPILFLKIVNSALNAMGFNFYITKQASRLGDEFSWTIEMNTEYLVDPVTLSAELKKYGCTINNIEKIKKTKWHYDIYAANAKLLSKKIMAEVSYKLEKPIKSYWLSFDTLPKSIYIKSYPLNRWHPYIVFYDASLDILSIFSNDEIVKNLKLDIPKGTKYMMIDDKYTLSNIRSGLKIYSK